jgi:hypothetical protein
MAMPAGARQAPWALDLKTALIWSVLAGLSAIALMPYLLQPAPQAFTRMRIPLPGFSHFSSDIVLHVFAPFTSVAPNA